MIGGGDTLPLSGRGVISDTASTALVAADGTLDWWTYGCVDADPIFWRLLDPDGAGLQLAPVGEPVTGTQRYAPDTMVLHTTLPAASGTLEIVDFFAWRGAGQATNGRIIRSLHALGGPVEVEVTVQPGRALRRTERVDTWSEGIAFDGIVVRTGCPMDARRGRLVVQPGAPHLVTIDPPGLQAAPLGDAAAADLLDRTLTAWRLHAGRVVTPAATGLVVRSALVLRALTHPAGGLAAAATTSLPEQPGGERNIDQRYVWLGDLAASIDTLRSLGLDEDADWSAEFVTRVLADAPTPAPVVCRVDGSPLEPGEEEYALRGYRSSQPVRFGSLAPGDHLADPWLSIGAILGATWPGADATADWLADHWATPSVGHWHRRDAAAQRPGSVLAAWGALERLTEARRSTDPLDLAAGSWWLAARDARRWLETNLVDAAPDATLLAVAWRGPWPRDEPRLTHLIDRLLRDLGDGPFVHRYPPDDDDGFPAGGPPSIVATLWAVRALATLERWDEAHMRLEAVVGLSGPLGLLPTAVDPRDRSFLGNLPSAAAHVAFIDAAHAVARGPR